MNAAKQPNNPPKRPLTPKRPLNLAARQNVLALWRGLDLAPLEKAAAHTSRPAREVLPKVLEELRIDRRRSEAEVLKVWNHLIDPNITQHAQPTGLHKGTLFVSVDNSVWHYEIIRYRSKEILQRLQHSFGRDLIAKISFRIG
jgi:predicted nucleic acid-binding Zn ribbon protein